MRRLHNDLFMPVSSPRAAFDRQVSKNNTHRLRRKRATTVGLGLGPAVKHANQDVSIGQVLQPAPEQSEWG